METYLAILGFLLVASWLFRYIAKARTDLLRRQIGRFMFDLQRGITIATRAANRRLQELRRCQWPTKACTCRSEKCGDRAREYLKRIRSDVDLDE